MILPPPGFAQPIPEPEPLTWQAGALSAARLIRRDLLRWLERIRKPEETVAAEVLLDLLQLHVRTMPLGKLLMLVENDLALPPTEP